MAFPTFSIWSQRFTPLRVSIFFRPGSARILVPLDSTILDEGFLQTCRFFLLCAGNTSQSLYSKMLHVTPSRVRPWPVTKFREIEGAPPPCRFFLQCVYSSLSNALSILLHLTPSRVGGVNWNCKISKGWRNFSRAGPKALLKCQRWTTYMQICGIVSFRGTFSAGSWTII